MGKLIFNLRKYYQTLEQAAGEKKLRTKYFPLKYGDKIYQLMVLESEKLEKFEKILFLRAGIHGTEPEGPLFLSQNLGWIVDYTHKRNTGLIIIPVGNPSGLEVGTEYNILGQKENNCHVKSVRINYPVPEEAKLMDLLLDKWLKKEHRPIRGVIDFHSETDPVKPFVREGTYCYVDKIDEKYLAILKRIEKFAPVLKNTSVVNFGPAKAWTDENGLVVFADGSLTDYLSSQGVDRCIAPEVITGMKMAQFSKIYWTWLTGVTDIIL